MFVRFRIILPVLLYNILADVAMHFLHPPSNFQLILWRNGHHLPSFPHQIQHELGDVPAGDGDVLYGTPDNVPLSARYNVGDTVTRVNNGSSERTIRDFVGGPGGSEGEHRLDGDVKTLDVERFEKDLCSLFPIFRCIKRRLGLTKTRVGYFALRSNFGRAPAESSDPLAPLSDT